ncbi:MULTISPECIES: 5'-methylthioadenosine/adenosylhomocysteine nucleosidase [Fusobacterium]|uniref:5'-methylthioadenosine/adenosylhomocysteine nucleosidase n=1 Tax=Fusobacterium TaxID=848 RepID=UPI00044E0289|nr:MULTISPECIES: 5'-methylthioadenosine/adenosylhomocysteine nucleosidase [Fusobacterium]EUB37636.1 MTA/SAH nucleosidase [Fusobacterium sp. OBRC1]WRL73342.1 5'-methylthioadenosine/adenosylhomocysteine nucleosidase [Fusobacterium polymorphum]
MKIGIIGAMHEEIMELKNSMTNINEVQISNLKFYEGKLCSKDIVLVESGIGKVNAAISTTLLISQFKVEKIIFTGVAGAVNPEIKVTDIVIGTDLVESDMDVTAGGNYKLGEIPRMKSSNFKADPYLFNLAESVAIKLFGSDKVHKGRIISRDEFVASSEKVNKLREIFSAECVEMEGAAVAHVCEVMNIPFIVIRSISDKADDEAGMSFDEFVKIAARNSKSIVEGILSIIK